MITKTQLKERVSRTWKKIDGVLAIVCFGGTMLFVGYSAATWQSATERQALLGRIDSVRAEMSRSCLAKMSGITGDLATQKGLVLSLTQTVNNLARKQQEVSDTTQTIAKRQAQGATIRKQENEQVARKAAAIAASEAVTKLDANTRKQIREAVRKP